MVNVRSLEEYDAHVKEGLDHLWGGKVVKDKGDVVLLTIDVERGVDGVGGLDYKVSEGCLGKANFNGHIPKGVRLEVDVVASKL